MEFLLISGMSGAGKSRAADVLEDLDYYCVDNMPIALLPRFAELCIATRGRYEKVALVTDIREGGDFSELFTALDSLWDLGCDYRILFMDADTPTIVKRYKESRRRHPLAGEDGTVEDAINRERELLEPVRDRADFIVNTSRMTLGMLQNELYNIFVTGPRDRSISISVIAFGFKYGIPIESDLVFDVRFMPNPYYVADLRDLTGLDTGVSEFVLNHPASIAFMEHLTGFLDFLMPQYIEEGKRTLTISVGCTGGRHRSVAVAAALTEYLQTGGWSCRLINRDLEK